MVFVPMPQEDVMSRVRSTLSLISTLLAAVFILAMPPLCMSSNVHAPRVVRTGARIAGPLGAKWYAVYVETPQKRPGKIRPDDSDALGS